MNRKNKHKKTRPWIKDECITRGTTSFELYFAAQFHLCSRDTTAPLDNGELPVSFSLTLSGGFDEVTVYRLALSRFAV
jgi:hypothetical protein